MHAVGILGVGHYVPHQILTNQGLVEMGLETSDEWISDRTGIKARRIAATEEATSDMACKAAQNAMRDAGVSPEDIDLVIVATSTPDYPLFPSVACLVQNRLGLRTVGAFDLYAACSGFTYAITCGSQFVKTGAAKHVLVVAADCLSRFINWEDRSVCILFGDGAGAAVLGPVPDGYGILSQHIHADGSEADILKVPGGGSRQPTTAEILAEKTNTITMNGQAVMKVAIKCVVPSLLTALKDANLTIQELDLFIPHQANLRIITHIAEKTQLPPEKVVINLDKYGNTSAASIAIALSEAKADGRLFNGATVALTGFGAGFTWGTVVLKWKSR